MAPGEARIRPGWQKAGTVLQEIGGRPRRLPGMEFRQESAGKDQPVEAGTILYKTFFDPKANPIKLFTAVIYRFSLSASLCPASLYVLV